MPLIRWGLQQHVRGQGSQHAKWGRGSYGLCQSICRCAAVRAEHARELSLGLYGDNGKDNGNHYLIMGYTYIAVTVKVYTSKIVPLEQENLTPAEFFGLCFTFAVSTSAGLEACLGCLS